MAEATLEVLVDTLEPTESLSFPLYVRLGDTLLLFRTARDRLGAGDIEELADGGKSAVYTPVALSKGYLPMLRNSFSQFLDAPGDPAEKLTQIYRQGTVATEHVLHHVETPESHDCASAFIASLLGILDECAQGFGETARLLEQDPNLAEHSVNVCLQGLLLGRALDYPDLPELGIGLLLHDVGALSLPETDRMPPDVEPAGEQAEERASRYPEHPLLGARRLARAPWLSASIRDVVQNHHERLDGSGFARGLRADSLSAAVRIAGIVDTFDLRVGREQGSNRQKRTFAVLQEMVREERGCYDPKMLQTFVELFGS